MKKNSDDYSARCLALTVESNFFAALESWGRSPQAELYRDSDMTRYVTGIGHPLFNGVFGTKLPYDAIEARIDETLSFFKSRNLPMIWWTGPTTEPPDLAEQLRARGMMDLPGQQSELPGMAVDLHNLKDQGMSPGGLTVEPVNDMDMLKSWVHAFVACFDLPVLTEKPCLALIAGAGFNLPWRHYVGLMGGQVVGISSLFLGAGVAGIYNVATFPGSRGKGIGTALTLVPLVEARQRGYRIGTLQSSPAGLGLYSRIGFVECCKIGLCISSGGNKTQGNT